jgi:hypothetical protein
MAKTADNPPHEPDRAAAETSAGAVQGGGDQDATSGPEPTDPDRTGEDELAGGLVVDPDADPPHEVQPTTS